MLGTATIVDNRNGLVEVVRLSRERTPDEAAFKAAEAEAARRNEREGWMRFVPVREHAGQPLRSTWLDVVRSLAWAAAERGEMEAPEVFRETFEAVREGMDRGELGF